MNDLLKEAFSVLSLIVNIVLLSVLIIAKHELRRIKNDTL
jgi:hypothetical protein